MTDLVERLRARKASFRKAKGLRLFDDSDAEDMAEAADEIERLREANIERWGNRMEHLVAEIERLKFLARRLAIRLLKHDPDAATAAIGYLDNESGQDLPI